MASQLVENDVAELSNLLRSKKISPLELTEAYLGRIAQFNDKYRAYITVTEDLAREQAREAGGEISAGRWRGPFHGIPIALKDLCYTKGIVTTGGSKILRDFKPDFDSTVAVRLREAGAILLGKLNLHEFAYGADSTNPHFGAVRNPYNREHIPGGSSGGSGPAIMLRMAAASIGTDTGGSIRIPSALCGCVGLKPTYGRVSRFGVIPLSTTLDHVGPITRNVRDAALMLNAIAGSDKNDPTASHEPMPDYAAGLDATVRGLKIGIVREFQGDVTADVEKAFAKAVATLKETGAEVTEVSVPALLDAVATLMPIIAAEAYEYHENWIRERPGDYGQDVRDLIMGGAGIPASAYIRSLRNREAARAEALRIYDRVDLLLTPGMAIGAPKIGQQTVSFGGKQRAALTELIRYTSAFNATGQPVAMVPMGMSSEGLPLALQLIGKPFDEATVLRMAHHYERARGPLPQPQLA